MTICCGLQGENRAAAEKLIFAQGGAVCHPSRPRINSRITIQSDDPLRQTFGIAFALFGNLDDGSGNQESHGRLTVIYLQTVARILECSNERLHVVGVKRRRLNGAFLFQKGVDRHVLQTHLHSPWSP